MTDPASPLAQMPAGLAYPSSKSALNMITALYARELRDTPIKVNAANPGYTKTDLNRNSGFRSVAEGAEAGVYLAALPADGPSGIPWGHLGTADGLSDACDTLPWWRWALCRLNGGPACRAWFSGRFHLYRLLAGTVRHRHGMGSPAMGWFS